MLLACLTWFQNAWQSNQIALQNIVLYWSHSFSVLKSTEVVGQNEWSLFSNMKYARSLPVVAAACGKMYALGGLDYRYRLVANAEVFDFEQGMWSDWVVPQFRIQRGTRAVAIDGFLYVMTGMCNVRLWIFNAASETLKQSETEPIIGTNYYIVAVDGLIYAMSNTLKNDRYCIMVSYYKPTTDNWSLWSLTVTSGCPFSLSLAAMDRVSKPIWRSNPGLSSWRSAVIRQVFERFDTKPGSCVITFDIAKICAVLRLMLVIDQKVIASCLHGRKQNKFGAKTFE